ncbi:methylglyoxal synthase [Wohlfahrtiimonas larvae]|uniref:Methylglyoxal synthase n=2 Tax=Wohlfahrtiimonas larvae TaxID=1157986 RepID=A0ABP9MK32_9GAMM
MLHKGIGLVAHDQKKIELVEWIKPHYDFFKEFPLYATGTTGKIILESYPDLNLTRLKSGPLGGDQQLGSLICTGELGLLIFFTDPLTPMPHDVDVKALIRLSTLYNIPMACNQGTADLLMKGLSHIYSQKG